MLKRIAALLMYGALGALSASAQTLTVRTGSQSSDAPGANVPVFHISVVGRTTPAINYRPRHGDTKIDFAPTPLLPKAEGRAEVSGEKGYIKIDAHFDHLQPATRF